MNRRKFIRLSALGTASLYALPSFLASCKKESLFEGKSYTGKVIVIGAGAAGLYAAYLLHLQGIQVTLLEASDQLGGRIKSLKGFANFDLDLGAERILGERSIWCDMVNASGAKFFPGNITDYYYFNGNLKTQAEAEENTFFNVMIQNLNSFATYSAGDVTAETYSNVSGISNNVDHIFNGLVGNRHGTSNTRIGMFGLREEAEKRTSGNEVFSVNNKSNQQILEDQYSAILDNIQFNTKIVTIDYSASTIVLTDSANQTYEANKVIVTVPLPILQQNLIQFTPALDASRQAAFNKIGMDRGMKIFLKFSDRLWAENTGSIFGNGLVPEFWPASSGGRSNDEFILTAFTSGEKAEQLASLNDQLLPTILSEIETLYPGAAALYVSHHIQDWGADPNILGAYSYPKPGTSTAREVIAKTIANKIYFAGEATHTKGHFGTVHGAMETGLRAVNEILESI